MPTPLDNDLVNDSLSGLTAWEGSAERLTRTITLDDSAFQRLCQLVEEMSEALGQRPVLERAGDQVTVCLSTPEVGAVSEVDIAMASRIDDFICQVTEWDRPHLVGYATTEDQTTSPDSVHDVGQAMSHRYDTVLPSGR